MASSERGRNPATARWIFLWKRFWDFDRSAPIRAGREGRQWGSSVRRREEGSRKERRLVDRPAKVGGGPHLLSMPILIATQNRCCGCFCLSVQ